MENYILKSNKTNYDKGFKIAKIILIILLILLLAVSILQYINYLEGQSCAVELMKSTSDEYDYFSGSYNELVEEIYNDLSPVYMSYGDGEFDNSGVVSSAIEVNMTLGEELSRRGYDCIRGTDYLEYRGIIGYFAFTIYYCIGDVGPLFFLFFTSIPYAIVFTILNFLYKKQSRKSICITEDTMICKKNDVIVKEFRISDINSIEIIGLKGLKFVGNNIKYSIRLIENRSEIKDYIMRKIVDTSNLSTNEIVLQSNADELKKFKDLVDNGIITQEEFEAKKKQLLNL